MEDIIHQVCEIKDTKERQKFVEKFRESQFLIEKNARKVKDEEYANIFRKALVYLKEGSDDEKIAALLVVRNIFSCLPSPLFIDEKESEISDEEVLGFIFECLRLLKDDNGNIRLNVTHTLNHLRIALDEVDYADLFYNLLSLRNSKEEKKKIRTIEFCLDKIYSPMLEMIIETHAPLESRKVKINLKEVKDLNERKLLSDLEAFSNKIVKETEKYIKRILKLRGEHLLEENLIRYWNNLSLFQISYEIQKIMEYIKEKNIGNDLLDRYIKFRLFLLLEKNLEWMKEVKNRNDFVYVDIILNDNKLVLSSLDNAYTRFSNIYDNLSKGILNLNF